MIPRYQRILFVVLLGSSAVMSVLLIYLHRHNFSDVKNADNTPIEVAAYTPTENIVLMLASDTDGGVKPVKRVFALPQQPAIRARALLDRLLAEYALPGAAHGIGGGVAVDDVFLVPLPLGGTLGTQLTAGPQDEDPLMHMPGQLAIVNLRSSWVDAHPSGISLETLTIQSIVATLHANLPEITAVRFLVDGKSRETLAGNIELDRTYDPLQTAQSIQ